MELKDFIRNTLTQIAQGVKEAIVDSQGNGYLVNPSNDEFGRDQTISFDVMVETVEKGGVNIRVVEGERSGKGVNRISFDVTMTLPCVNDGRVHELKRPERPSNRRDRPQ